MMAFVFMFKSLPVLISPNASNTLVASAVETVRPYMLQYPPLCVLLAKQQFP